jgi:hypothetical protein
MLETGSLADVTAASQERHFSRTSQPMLKIISSAKALQNRLQPIFTLVSTFIAEAE